MGISHGELLSIGKPVMSAVADLMSADAEERAGRPQQANAMYVRYFGDLLDAVDSVRKVLMSSTSNGRDLAPSRPDRNNLSGLWREEDGDGTINVFHSDAGMIVIQDGDDRYIGGAEYTAEGTQFFTTCHTRQGWNMLWHGVGGRDTLATRLRDMDNGSVREYWFQRA